MITITIIFIIVITIVIIIYLIKQVTCKEAFTATQLPPFKVNHSTARDLHNQPRSQGSWNEVSTYSSLRTVLWVPSFAFHKNQNSERAVRRGLSHDFSSSSEKATHVYQNKDILRSWSGRDLIPRSAAFSRSAEWRLSNWANEAAVSNALGQLRRILTHKKFKCDEFCLQTKLCGNCCFVSPVWC